MNILLINANPVVSRLIYIFINEETSIDEPSVLLQLKLSKYDLVFVDDDSYCLEIEQLLQNTPFLKKVLLSAKEMPNEVIQCFDEVIQKPFLPSQIRKVIKSTSNHVKDNIEEDTSKSLDKSHILNKQEIGNIKKLLEESENSEVSLIDEDSYGSHKVEVITEHLELDGLEIVNEDKIVDILSKKYKKEHGKEKRRKKSLKSSKISKTSEDTFLLALEHMGIKKLRKLLKGAEINISIKFKDDK